MNPTPDRHFEGPRGTRPEEFEALVKLLNSVFRPQTQSMTREHGYMYGLGNAEYLRIMLADGVPVSHFGTKLWGISVLGVPLRMASVGGVCTHPDFRGKGLATVLLQDAEELFRAVGADLVLISGGRGIYVTNGYGKAGRCLVFDLEAGAAAKLAAPELRIRAATAADLRLLAGFAEREPVRYHRPLDEFAQLVAGRQARIIPDQFVIVSCAGEDMAWFDLMTSLDGKTRTLWEYAGDRAAVLAGLELHMRAQGFARVNVPLMAHDAAMTSRLRLVAAAREEDIPEHTAKILDFKGFMEKIRPVFQQRLGADLLDKLSFTNAGAGGVIRAGAEALALPDSREVVKLVFGSAEPVAALSGAGPQIRAFVQAALPLPMVWPGINYV